MMKVRQTLTAPGFLVLIFLLILYCGCSQDDTYRQEIRAWHEARMERLRGPRGWPALAGLYLLSQGVSTAGSADSSNIRFPDSAPPALGRIRVDSNGIEMQPDAGISILMENGQQFRGGRIDLQDPPLLHHEALYWTFIQRAGQNYLRLWDTLSIGRQTFADIPYYPIDPSWRIPVTFVPADSGATIELDDVLGLKRVLAVAGTLNGKRNGTAFSLIALDDGEESLFVIFEDLTTGEETYDAGRYIDMPLPDQDGKGFLDFNKAYTPPCAFTEFATCLIPPRENVLPFEVTAGEKGGVH